MGQGDSGCERHNTTNMTDKQNCNNNGKEEERQDSHMATGAIRQTEHPIHNSDKQGTDYSARRSMADWYGKMNFSKKRDLPSPYIQAYLLFCQAISVQYTHEKSISSNYDNIIEIFISFGKMMNLGLSNTSSVCT